MNIFVKYTLINANEHKAIVPSFNLSKGEMVALVGPSGVGKSTFAKNLADDFSLGVAGEAKRDIKVIYVPQEPFIMKGTLQENLFQKSPIDLNLIKKWNLENLINKPITELGTNLSGGQKQRIGILRALKPNSDLVIFDEPTSQLNMEYEDLFVEFLVEHFCSKAVLVITHSPNLQEKLDRKIFIRYA